MREGREAMSREGRDPSCPDSDVVIRGGRRGEQAWPAGSLGWGCEAEEGVEEGLERSGLGMFVSAIGEPKGKQEGEGDNCGRWEVTGPSALAPCTHSRRQSPIPVEDCACRKQPHSSVLEVPGLLHTP